MRSSAPDLLPGTLDLLILRVLARDSMHGYGVAQRLKALSAVQRIGRHVIAAGKSA